MHQGILAIDASRDHGGSPIFKLCRYASLSCFAQVPYLAKKAFKISEDYTAPAGTMVIPSFWNSLHDDTVYPKPDEFIPERWMPLPEGGVPLAEQSPQNYMVWGSGPHKVSSQMIIPAERI